jgi:diguanylate cyclase (GGDEF)-like protein
MNFNMKKRDALKFLIKDYIWNKTVYPLISTHIGAKAFCILDEEGNFVEGYKTSDQSCQLEEESPICKGLYLNLSRDARKRRHLIIKECTSGFLGFAFPAFLDKELYGIVTGCQIEKPLSQILPQELKTTSLDKIKKNLKFVSNLVERLLCLIVNSDEKKILSCVNEIFWQDRSHILELESEEFSSLIVGVTALAMKVKNCSLLLIQKDKNEVLIKGAVGFDRRLIGSKKIRMDQGIIGYVIGHKRPIVVKEIEPAQDKLSSENFLKAQSERSLILAPLQINGEVLGVIAISDEGKSCPFHEEDSLLLANLCDVLVPIIKEREVRIKREKKKFDQEIEELKREIEEELIKIKEHSSQIKKSDLEIERLKHFLDEEKEPAIKKLEIEDLEKRIEEFKAKLKDDEEKINHQAERLAIIQSEAWELISKLEELENTRSILEEFRNEIAIEKRGLIAAKRKLREEEERLKALKLELEQREVLNLQSTDELILQKSLLKEGSLTRFMDFAESIVKLANIRREYINVEKELLKAQLTNNKDQQGILQKQLLELKEKIDQLERLRIHSGELGFICQVMEKTLNILDPKKILDYVLAEACSFLDCPIGAYIIHTDGAFYGKILESIALSREFEEELRQKLIEKWYEINLKERSRRHKAVFDIQIKRVDLPIEQHNLPEVIRSTIYSPIMEVARNVGCFVLWDLREDAFTLYDQKMLLIIAEYVSIAFQRSRLFNEIKQQTERDPLTGAYNCHYFEEFLKKELAHARHDSLPLSLIMFDFDRFRDFNDHWGHDQGSKTLKLIVNLIKRHLRKMDYLARFGGDEFCIILPDMNLERSRVLAERIREVVYKHKIKIQNKTCNLSISVGVASVPNPKIKDFKGLIKAADTALYLAKREGRNQVRVFE